MLVVLEGPDKCGKTTLYNELKRVLPATFVDVPKLTATSLQFMDEYNALHRAVFCAMHRNDELYVMDRCAAVSGHVYGELYGRQKPEPWDVPMHVFYLAVPTVMLHRRGKDELFNPEHYDRVQELYLQRLRELWCTVLNGLQTKEELVLEVLKWARNWKEEQDGRAEKAGAGVC